MRFLFWNLNKNDIPGWVHKLALQEAANVLILAECRIPPAQLLEQLNADSADYHYAPGNCGHLVFFTRFDARFLTPLVESHRVSNMPDDLWPSNIADANLTTPVTILKQQAMALRFIVAKASPITTISLLLPWRNTLNM